MKGRNLRECWDPSDRSLRIENLGLRKLPDLGEFASAEILDISFNRFKTVPPAVTQLGSLRELHIDSLGLQSLQSELASINTLEVLSATRNHLSSLPDTFAELPRLAEVHLSINNFVELPVFLSGSAVTLRHLSLDVNELVGVSSEIGGYTRLEGLELSWNRITGFPMVVFELGLLTTLGLSGTATRALPDRFDRLPRLEELVLRECELSDLPASIGGLNLRRLDLAGNKFEQIPKPTWSLDQLTELSLRDTKLSTLPGDLSQLRSLRSLDLSGNDLTELPEIISRLQNLEELSVNGNQLRSIPNSIGLLSNLRSLDVGNNRLTKLPRELSQLSQLSTLHIAGNDIDSVPPELIENTAIQSIGPGEEADPFCLTYSRGQLSKGLVASLRAAARYQT